jgi:DNA-directed RNA polymerase specialized sigma24 family protein
MTAALTTDDYERQRAAVHAHLRASFGQLFDESERDDLLHDAWTAIVVKREAGESIDNETALLKTISFRRGRDRLRGRHSDPCDPLEGPLTLVADGRPSAEERVTVQLEADLCREVIAALNERQQKLLRLRLDWAIPAAEVQQIMGMSARTYERQMGRALKRVAQIVGEIEDGTWSQKQLDLLIAVESGTATPEQRAAAQRLVERDPHCRALLGRLRGAAAVMPLPFLPGSSEAVQGITGFFASFKDQATGIVARVRGGADVVAPLASDGRAKGAGGLGGIATAKAASLLAVSTIVAGTAAMGTGAIEVPSGGTPQAQTETAPAGTKPAVHVASATASSGDDARRRAAKRRTARRRAIRRASRRGQRPAAPTQTGPRGQTAAVQRAPVQSAPQPTPPAGSSPGATSTARPQAAAPAAPAELGGEFGP